MYISCCMAVMGKPGAVIGESCHGEAVMGEPLWGGAVMGEQS